MAIFAGSLDPLTPALLQAAALGWPLLLHSPGARPLTSALGRVLHPEQHLQTFAGRADLLAALRKIRQDREGTERRAVRARKHVREEHSYLRRLGELVELVRRGSAVRNA